MTPQTQRVAGEANSPNKENGSRKSPSRSLVLPLTLTVKNLAELVNDSPVDVIKQ